MQNKVEIHKVLHFAFVVPGLQCGTLFMSCSRTCQQGVIYTFGISFETGYCNLKFLSHYLRPD